jgi:uncharacterized protein (DUF2461 family)
MGGPTFDGFPAQTFAFYRALARGNTDEFWRAHKPEYLRYGWDEMQRLLDSLPEFGQGRPLSPHRDRRSRGDRPPIKEYLAGRIQRVEGIWCYVELSVDELIAAAGLADPSADQVGRLRAAIAAPAAGAELESIVDDMRSQGLEMVGERVKTAPRGFERDHPRIELLRHRTLLAQRRWPYGRWLRSPEVRDRIAETWRHCRPLIEWLHEHVGPPAG